MESDTSILPKNETLVYYDLVKNGASKPAAISRRTRVPRNKVYDALYRLEQKGLVMSENIPTKLFLAREPKKLLEMTRQRFQEQQMMLADLEGKIPELDVLYEMNKTPVPIFSYARGMKNIIDDIRKEISQSKSFIYVFARKMVFFEEHKLMSAYKLLAKKGVDVRVITIDDPKARELTRKMGAKGMFLPKEFQFTRTMIVKDDVFAISIYGKGQELRIKTESPDLVEAFKTMFLVIWSLKQSKN